MVCDAGGCWLVLFGGLLLDGYVCGGCVVGWVAFVG